MVIDENYSGIPRTKGRLFPYILAGQLDGTLTIHGVGLKEEIFQIPPIEYLVNRRLKIAKHLLKSTNLSIGEIGIKVGYEDLYYFSKWFKRKTGNDPSHFRSSDY